jgi:3D (Asp-Asp-Asp) domain-containing protein
MAVVLTAATVLLSGCFGGPSGAVSAPVVRTPPPATADASSTATAPAATSATGARPTPVQPPVAPAAPGTSSAPATTNSAARPSPVAPRPPVRVDPPAPVPRPNASGLITFYAARDDDPPDSRTIDAPVLHALAGGTGTFADPITFAAQQGVFPPATRIYVPEVSRYFLLEDSCATCVGSHVDLWAGPATDDGVLACEDALTRSGAQPYEVNPPPGLPVIPGDLYRNGTCFQP